ncbi:Bardet-Biedl syndrome 7 protein [Blyttiomyces sp. JEL0837]|nr:Bardet-Biedl syndrome 7 protein [Blyttiomyces sp. JEL0837]
MEVWDDSMRSDRIGGDSTYSGERGDHYGVGQRTTMHGSCQLVVGDEDGMVTCFDVFSASVKTLWKMKMERQISAIAVDASHSSMIKIAVAIGPEIHLLSEKGERMHIVETSLTEVIRFLDINGIYVSVVGEYVFNIYVNGKDSGFFLCPDKIGYMTSLPLRGQSNQPLMALACNDGVVRVFEKDNVRLTIPLESPPTCLLVWYWSPTANEVHLVVGTGTGAILCFRITMNEFAETWRIQTGHTLQKISSNTTASSSKVTALSTIRLSQSSPSLPPDLIVGREDGSVQCYGVVRSPVSALVSESESARMQNEQAPLNSFIPYLAVERNLGESVTDLVGVMIPSVALPDELDQTANLPKIIATTFSGRLVGLICLLDGTIDKQSNVIGDMVGHEITFSDGKQQQRPEDIDSLPQSELSIERDQRGVNSPEESLRPIKPSFPMPSILGNLPPLPPNRSLVGLRRPQLQSLSSSGSSNFVQSLIDETSKEVEILEKRKVGKVSMRGQQLSSVKGSKPSKSVIEPLVHEEFGSAVKATIEIPQEQSTEESTLVVKTLLILDPAMERYRYIIESNQPLDCVALKANFWIQIEDDGADSHGVLTTHQNTQQSEVTVTYSCKENVNRVSLFLVPTEGKYGTVTSQVIASGDMGQWTEVTDEVKPFSLHIRQSTQPDFGSLANSLSVLSDVSIAELHYWVSCAFSGIPDRRGYLDFKTNSAATIGILRNLVTDLANQRNRKINMTHKLDEHSITRMLSIILKPIERYKEITRQLLLSQAVAEVCEDFSEIPVIPLAADEWCDPKDQNTSVMSFSQVWGGDYIMLLESRNEIEAELANLEPKMGRTLM